MDKVLITNAGYGNGLAAIRGIAKSGIKVITADTDRFAASCYSRFVKKSYIYSSPDENQEKFIADLIEIIKTEKPDVLLPISTDTFLTVSKYKKELERYVKIPVADYDKIIIAHNKLASADLAEKTGVPYPKTIIYDRTVPLESILEKLGLPVIIKARLGTGLYGKADSKEEAKKLIERIESSKVLSGVIDGEYPIIQEFIDGEIHDVCVLLNNGKLRAAMTQKRIRTYPISGGPGILNETTKEPKLIDYADKMLSEINYHGPALVEYIVDKNGEAKVIEINTKFWGTTALSIAAGVNFPLLTYKMAKDGDVEPVFDYTVGARYRWFFPAGLEYVFQSKNKFKSAVEFFNCFGKDNHSDFSISDPMPTIFELSRMISKIIFPEKFRRKVIKPMFNIFNFTRK